MNSFENPVAISVIIVSYNTLQLTLKAIETLQIETYVSHEIIVIDNASTDGSADAIEKKFAGLNLIRSKENLGFAAANNLAASYASGDYLLLLNPDTEVLDGAVDQLYKFAKDNPRCGIWGGKTLFDDMSLNPSSCWKQQSIWSLLCQTIGLNSIFRRVKLFNPESLGGWNRDDERDVDIVSGCFLLTRMETWKALNGFNKKYFMYGEEADFCLRSKSLGTQPRVTPKAVIIHHGGRSEKVKADKLVRLLTAKTYLIDDHFREAKVLGRLLLKMWPISRFLAHSVLASTGLTRSREKKQIWGEVWRRRDEWG